MAERSPIRTRRIRVGEWLVDYDDARQTVKLDRSVLDVLTAVPGSDQDCMNSQCIRAQRNAHVFPHPVLVVSTIKSRVYIIDKVDDTGTPIHAVRYQLSDADQDRIDKHDRLGVGETGRLVLHKPKDPKGSPKRREYGGGYATTGQGRTTKRDTRPVTRGAVARYKVAVGGLSE